MGARHTFEIWSYHKNLEYFASARHLNRCQARWSSELAEFDFTLHHKPGTSMGRADTLSRRKDHKEGVEDDNSDVLLLKPEQCHALKVEDGGDEFLAEIQNTTQQDLSVKTTLEEKLKDYKEHEGVVTKNGLVYVRKAGTLRERIIRAHHDSVASGHPGSFQTMEKILRNYWWPRIHFNVSEYVSGCETCQCTKIFPDRPWGALLPNPVPSRPWSFVNVDLITQLPPSRGYNAIFVTVCRLTKRMKCKPTMSNIDSKGIAKLMRDLRSTRPTRLRLNALPRSLMHHISNCTRTIQTAIGLRHA